MVKPHTSMKRHIVKTEEDKEDQQFQMVDDCRFYWCKDNNNDYPYYPHVMNMKTRIWNHEHNCYFVTSYHFNPNKW